MTNKSVLILGSFLAISNSAVSADADVSFYGLVDVYLASAQAPGSNDDKLAVDSSGMTTSFFGVKTTVDMGSGLTGLAVLEGFLRPDVGDAGRYDGDPFWARDAFVGLKGGFGSVMLGRNTTPYYISVISTNPFGGSFGFAPSIKNSFLGGLNGDSGWNNTLAYSMPTGGPVTATLMYGAGEVVGDTGIDKIGANVFYSAGALTATVSYQSVDSLIDDANAAADDTQSATMLGAKYNLGNSSLFAQYLTMSTDVAAGKTDYDTYKIGAAVPAGKGKVLASYAHTDTSGLSETERDTAALGYDIFYTKKIDLYAVFYWDDQSNVGDGNTVAIGGRFRF